MSGKIIIKNQACLDEDECASSDAMQIYENGSAYCFSCRKSFSRREVEEVHDLSGHDLTEEEPKKSKFKVPGIRPAVAKIKEPDAANQAPVVEVPDTEVDEETGALLDYQSPAFENEDIMEFPIRGWRERKIKKVICEFFGVRSDTKGEGPEMKVIKQYYPFKEGGWHVRYVVPKKDFRWIGKAGRLFGVDRFRPGGKRVVVTEGEVDAMSVAQASYDHYGKVYPVVAIPGAEFVKHLVEYRDWLRTFDAVILMLDKDPPGLEAQAIAIKIIGFDKVRVAEYPQGIKDPNQLLVTHGSTEVNRAIWDAQPYKPAGVVGRTAIWNEVVEYSNKQSIPYPACMQGVNSKTKGMRMNDITLFISGTGVGKSTMMREIVLHLRAVDPSAKIGIAAFEETVGETARKLACTNAGINPSTADLSVDELKPLFDKLFGTGVDDDPILMLNHQGAIADSSILDLLEYMALMGCKYIFIDHLTMLVSEGFEGLDGNSAQDKIMNALLRFVKRHDVWLGLISHLRKTPNDKAKGFEQGRLPNQDDIRGSGSTKQVSMDIIAFARDTTNEDEDKRNTVKMSVLKCRHTGLTGPCEGMYYEHATGRYVSESAKLGGVFSMGDFEDGE